MSDESKRETEDFVSLLRNNAELLKPNFGVMFWQLQSIEQSMTAEEFASEGANFALESADDEIVAAFIAGYVKAWLSSGDFNSASRFVAHTLAMSVDELLQTRGLYLKAQV